MKKPEEPSGAWDDDLVIGQVPAEQALRPLGAAGCEQPGVR